MPAEKQMFTVGEISEKYGVSRKKVCLWIASKRLHAVDVSSVSSKIPIWRISASDLETFFAGRSEDASPVKRVVKKKLNKSVTKFFK